MRILQLIDSLRPGGAEKMSVTYANALAKRIDASFLCCTRKEGLLKKQLSPEVGYLFLNKKSSLDLYAFQKLRRFVEENKIDLIQAHSSSWFLALMVKLSLPGVKLVWHDHYGRELSKRKPELIKPASKFLDGIIAVNKNLLTWSKKNLNSKEVRYVKNFLEEDSASREPVQLGGAMSFKIICLANFRPQKDHLTLLAAFLEVLQERPAVSLHLVGNFNEDDYSQKILSFIEENHLKENVFLYGEQEQVHNFLIQADLGVLSSESEGLPVALLEYGQSELPVVCTSVGECREVIGSHGTLVPPKNPGALAAAIIYHIDNEAPRKAMAREFHQKIITQYSEEAIIQEVLEFFSQLVGKQFYG